MILRNEMEFIFLSTKETPSSMTFLSRISQTFQKIANTITHSKLWYHFWEFRYRMGFRYIRWLLKINGIKAPANKDPLWHYLLGELTQRASTEPSGIAVKNLYLINNRLFKIRGFTLISVMNSPDNIRRFCNLDARDAYYILGGLIQLPILNAGNWHKETREEKYHLIKTFERKSYDMWLQVKKSCSHLSTTWKNDKHLPHNVSMQAFSILGAVLFSLDELPDELLELIEKFENIWGNPHDFRAAELHQNVSNFNAISQDLHRQRKDKRLAQNDLLNVLHDKHKSRQYNLNTPEDINIAAYFTFFENIPKAMMGLFTTVFSKEKWRTQIMQERKRLKAELRLRDLKPDSEAGYQYILSHSETFERFYMEVLRFWTVAPVLPRVNTNIFSNKILGWGSAMNISDEQTLPPMSIAVVPQYAISRKEEWEDAKKFNPNRAQYTFEINSAGAVQSKGMTPLVQGAADSFRGCPARKFARKYTYSMLWWFLKYNELKLSKEERKILKQPLSPDTYYRPIATTETKQVYGELRKSKRSSYSN